MRRLLNNIRNHKNWNSYLAFKYFKQNKEAFTFKCRSNINIEVPKRMLQTYKESFFDESYFKGFANAVLKETHPTVIDIGANVGYFSLSALNKNPNAIVFAYEPMPNNFKLLSKYKNKFSNLNLNIFNSAVSSKDSSISLNYDASEDFTTAATIINKASQQDTIEVKTVSLASIISQNNINTIDFFKLDCEGSEYDILYNIDDSTYDKIKNIAIETHKVDDNEKNKEHLANFLKNKKFNITLERDMIWGWK